LLTFHFGQTNCTGTAHPTVMSDGKCDSMPMIGLDMFQTYKDCQGTPLPVTQVACAVTASLPTLTPGAAGRTCAPSGSVGGTCPAGSTCLPPAAAGTLCVQHDGDMMCPDPGLMHRYVVYAPSNVIDERQCGQCMCTSDATMCSNATLTTYHASDCSGPSITVPIDSNCENLPMGSDNSMDDHLIYNATPNKTTCSPASATVMVVGSIVTNNPKTICCP
jgi:hypothetical protein